MNSKVRLSSAWLVRTSVFVHDLLVVMLAFVLSIAIRLGPEAVDDFVWSAIWFTVLSIFSNAIMGVNSGLWRYASLADLEAIVKSATLTVALFAISMFLINRLDNVPRSAFLVVLPLMIGLLSASRVAYRMHRNRRARRSASRMTNRNLLIVGLSEAGENFIKAVNERSDLNFNIVGIIDERGRRAGFSVRGIRVLGDLDEIDGAIDLLARRGLPPHGILVARTSLFQDRKVLDLITGAAQKAKIELLRLPELENLRSEASKFQKIEPQPIVLDDLLPRAQITLDSGPVRELVANSCVLVTGAGGSIGSELCRQLHALSPRRMILVDSSEYLLYLISNEIERGKSTVEVSSRLGNVRDRKEMFALFDEVRPEIVFHAAALKHVPMVESQPLEGLATNVLGTRNIADAAVRVDARAMVMVSTDKAVNPTNVMGASKRMAEAYCQALDRSTDTHFVTVRFGNVLGSAGSVVPLFERQIRAGGPLTVTHPEIERYFMTIPEAVQLILHSTSYGVTSTSERRGQIFVLDMGTPVKIVDVARKMITLAGFEPDVDIKIEFIGLRLGEKLYEELFDHREMPTSTQISGVLSAGPREQFDRQTLAVKLDELSAHIAGRDLGAAIGLLCLVVPEYSVDTRLAAQLRPGGKPDNIQLIRQA